MNHDFAHCLDYDEKKCPKKCFRGALVRDLPTTPDFMPITWAHFEGTQYCEKEEKMNLINLKNEVETAKELLAQAEDNYKKGILEAAQNGELEQRKTAMWKEVYNAAESKTKFYCDGCGFYAPLQSDYCPKCGARMCNTQHYVPKQAAAFLQDTAQITISEPSSADIIRPNDWNGKTKNQKQDIVYSECERLIAQHHGAVHASRYLQRSDGYISFVKSKIRSGDTPRYATYLELAKR